MKADTTLLETSEAKTENQSLPYYWAQVSANLAILNINAFRTELKEFLKQGPSRFKNGATYLSRAYKSISTNQDIDESSEYIDLFIALTQPHALKVASRSLNDILSKNKVSLDKNALALAISVLEDSLGLERNKITAKVIAGEIAIVQIFTDSNTSVAYAINKHQIEKFVDAHKEGAMFIKVFTADKIIHEFFPPKQELIDCLKLALQNNDFSFIQLCIDNKKLSKEIVAEAVDSLDLAKVDLDILNIITENHLFDFGSLARIYKSSQNRKDISQTEELLNHKSIVNAELKTIVLPINTTLAELLKLAFENNDMELIKLCRDKKVLSKGIFQDTEFSVDLLYETFARGRLDLLSIMIESQLFGFGIEDIEKVDAPFDSGLTPLMKACRDGDVIYAKLVLAQGANPSLTDSKGYTALMHAVTYPEDMIVALKKPETEQSEEIKKLKIAKNEIVAALLRDKRVDVNAKCRDETALNILVRQGIIQTPHYAIRGDNKSIEKLIAAGADPLFGKYASLSFKAQTFITFLLHCGVSVAKKYLPIFGYLLDPIVRYKAYLDAKELLYHTSLTSLNTEHAQNAVINIDKTVMIGAYHIKWNGNVIFGDELKQSMQQYWSYTKTDSAYYNATDLDTMSTNPTLWTPKKQLEVTEVLFSRYYRIQEFLKNKTMFTWTRKALEKLSNELQEAHSKITAGYKITDEFNKQLGGVFNNLINHDKIANEIYASAEHRILFYKIYGSVKTGSLRVDLETKYSLEKVHQKLLSTVTAETSFGAFSEFSTYCNSFVLTTARGNVDLYTTLMVMEHEFKRDLQEIAREQKTLFERFKETTCNLTRRAITTGVAVTSFITGASNAHIYHNLAEGLSTAGAIGNVGLHHGANMLANSLYEGLMALPAMALYYVGAKINIILAYSLYPAALFTYGVLQSIAHSDLMKQAYRGIVDTAYSSAVMIEILVNSLYNTLSSVATSTLDSGKASINVALKAASFIGSSVTFTDMVSKSLSTELSMTPT